MKNHFSQNLHDLRQEKGISQYKLALELNYTQSNISEWEKGSVEPKATALICLANYFGVTTDYLLGLEDDFGTRTTHTAAPMSNEYTLEEKKFIEDLRTLTPGMRDILRTTLSAMMSDKREKV